MLVNIVTASGVQIGVLLGSSLARIMDSDPKAGDPDLGAAGSFGVEDVSFGVGDLDLLDDDFLVVSGDFDRTDFLLFSGDLGGGVGDFAFDAGAAGFGSGGGVVSFVAIGGIGTGIGWGPLTATSKLMKNSQ